MLRLLFHIFFITTFPCNFIYGAEFLECLNEPMESFIAVAYNCSKAIYCKGVDSSIEDCSKDSPYFSSEDRKCHNSTRVCGNRPFRLLNIPTTTTLSPPTTVTIIEANTNPTITLSSEATSTVATTTEQLLRNTTKENTLTTTLTSYKTDSTSSESSPSTVFTTSITKITTTTETLPIFVQCPAVDDLSKPLFLPHPKSCSWYYLCYHGVPTLMKCPNKLHFDVTQQTCNTPKAANCRVNSIIPRENCRYYIVDFYPHPTNCNYYYLCEYGFLMVMQCPFNMYWDYEDRVCASKSRAKCYNAHFVS